MASTSSFLVTSARCRVGACRRELQGSAQRSGWCARRECAAVCCTSTYRPTACVPLPRVRSWPALQGTRDRPQRTVFLVLIAREVALRCRRSCLLLASTLLAAICTSLRHVTDAKPHRDLYSNEVLRAGNTSESSLHLASSRGPKLGTH
jgi:hypothetical protein